ncbi:MAG: prepilin-type N-terminal cleavage/methylation domain-containing protein [bacterium]|nr:prepilin-type N-terminal cleavage/methylation domain-containing protein [bacterium]
MKRAFTLIEVIITVSLSVILMLAITQLYVVYGRVVTSQNAYINVVLGAGKIMDSFRLAGLQANSVVASHTFFGVGYTSGASTVIFKIPSIDSSGSIIMGAYDYVGIHASGTDAYRFVDAASGSSRVTEQKRLTNALSSMIFTYDNAELSLSTNVIANATTSSAIGGETMQMHLNEHVYLRNL